MTQAAEFEGMVEAARGCVRDSSRSAMRPVGARSPRFELFHAGMSLCSQKVRTVLAEKNAPYASRDMEIICRLDQDGRVVPAENYHPDYVRLRLTGGVWSGAPLVAAYGGRSDVTTQGFDPCVVPLLVDHQEERVVVDSLAICRHLDEALPGSALFPTDGMASAVVDRHVRIVDGMPHPSMLYGFHPDDRRPDTLRRIMETVYDNKVTALEELVRRNADDPLLVDAYRAKLTKETGGKSVSRDPDFQKARRMAAAEAVHQLDRDLDASADGWVAGATFSMADVFWGVSLLRMKYLGLASIWDDLPNVALLLERLSQRPSLRAEALQATLDSLPPSEHLRTDAVAAEASYA